LEEDIMLSPDEGGKHMPFPSYICSEELAMLTTALNNHCLAYAIPVGDERDDGARLIMALFGTGLTNADDMKAALIAARGSRP